MEAKEFFYKFGFVIMGLIVAVFISILAPRPMGIVISIVLVVALIGIQLVVYIIKTKLILVDVDLVYTLLHSRLIASGKPPIGDIFKSVAERREVYGGYADIARRVYLLGKEWGYSFPQAIRIVADSIRDKVTKNILYRLGGVLAVGEDVEQFLEREYITLLAEYRSIYTRTMDNTRVLLGLYVTMIGSLMFLAATFLILSVFFGSNAGILKASYFGIELALIVQAVLVYISVRPEPFEYEGRENRTRRLLRLIGMAMIAASIFSGVLLVLKGVTGYKLISLTLLVLGITTLPIGLTGKLGESQVKEIDEFFSVFIRSYGMHLATIPNMIKSLEPLLASNLGPLIQPLKRLYARLVNSILPNHAWTLFSRDTRSELVHRGTVMFIDTIEYGGDPGLAGSLISDHHNEMNRLRKVRYEVSSTFSSTLLIMHATAISILIVMAELMNLFSNVISTLSTQVPPQFVSLFPFSAVNMSIISIFNSIIIITLTIANSAVLYRVAPGSKLSFFYYLGLYAIVSAGTVYASAILIDMVFSKVIVPTGILPV
ncbi:MAG: type II secretion system F family protein [Desulfurococcales archaeon]|nr:type II secretion system F family protein [Desulfurococcales archaeon]